jgi:mono/diheme cytochrome c family protein
MVIGLFPLGHAVAAPPATVQVELGRHLFARTWEPALPGPESGDGLGPLFNGRSCAECHHQAGIGGGGSLRHNVQFIRPILAGTESQFGFGAVPPEPSRDRRGRSSPVVMLHRFGVRREYGAWRANEIVALTRLDPDVASTIGFPYHGRTLALRLDLLLASTPATNLGKSPVVEAIRLRVDPPPGPSTAASRSVNYCSIGCRSYVRFYLGPRFWEVNTPPLFGLGLLEQVTLADVRAIAAKQTAEIRGRPVILPDGRLGRFGWKAQHASLRDFSDEACAMELGITTPTSRQAPSPKLSQADEDEARSPYWRTVRANPDISAAGVDALTAFVAGLPQPRELFETDPLLAATWSDPAATGATRAEPSAPAKHSEQADVQVGWHWFHSIGCAGCHTPNLGPVRGAYSDLLLHDVKTEPDVSYFQRGENEHAAGPGQLRTPPLWGVADSAPYLHNGSASTLDQAILAHGGQAESAAKQFREKLSPNKRRQVIAFLNSLRAPHFN